MTESTEEFVNVPVPKDRVMEVYALLATPVAPTELVPGVRYVITYEKQTARGTRGEHGSFTGTLRVPKGMRQRSGPLVFRDIVLASGRRPPSYKSIWPRDITAAERV